MTEDPKDILETEEYRQLYDRMDEGYCVIEFIAGPGGENDDYIHVSANPAFARHAGIENVVGQKLRTMLPDEADAWLARYGEVLRTGKPIRFEQELVATGRHLALSAFRIEPPERKRVAVLFEDITAERAKDAELRRLNDVLSERIEGVVADREMFASMIETADTPVQIIDMNLGVIAANAAAAEEFRTRFSLPVKAGDSLPELLDGLGDHRDMILERWRRALSGETFEVVESFEEGSEEKHLELRMRPLRDREGAIIGAYKIGYDVTAAVNDQRRREEAEESLRQSQKMEAIGQLTGGLAHDFNNLLTAISGAFEMMAMRLKQGKVEDLDRYITAGQGASRRAASLTHRLLAFARRQTLSPKLIQVNRLLGDLSELVRRTVGPEVEVETIAASGLWSTSADANQLENAILNLCINARDAMPGGGKLTIETGNRWIDRAQAAHLDIDPGQYVSVCVSDTGAGIPQDVLPKVFDPYFTTKPIGSGTGLGLSMVYGFAKQSDGHVTIYSEPDEGTMVCIYLPRQHGDAEHVPKQEVSEPQRAVHDGAVVLVVDDEPTVRMLLTDALKDMGLASIEADSGAKALAIVKSDRRIDLLISDVGMPGGMNGRQLADLSREERPDMPVLFVTGYAENAAFNHGHVEPGMEVLTKPFPIETLQRRVSQILEC